MLADAEKLSGQKFDISSYSDIVQAIHVVQTEMGITGTTAKEAASTISGSIASMKSSWQNLLTGIADGNQNTGELVGQFVDSAVTVASNLLPRIQEIFLGIGDLITGLAPVLSELLPQLITDILPSLLDSGLMLVLSIAQGIIDNLDQIINAAVQIVTSLIERITSNLPEIIKMGITLIAKLAVGLVQAIPDLVREIPTIVAAMALAFRQVLPELINVGKEMIQGIWQGIQELAGWLWDSVVGMVNNIVSGVKNALGIHSPSKVFAGIGDNMALGLAEGWDDEFSAVKKDIDSDMTFSGSITNNANLGGGGSSVMDDRMTEVMTVLCNRIISAINAIDMHPVVDIKEMTTAITAKQRQQARALGV